MLDDRQGESFLLTVYHQGIPEEHGALRAYNKRSWYSGIKEGLWRKQCWSWALDNKYSHPQAVSTFLPMTVGRILCQTGSRSYLVSKKWTLDRESQGGAWQISYERVSQGESCIWLWRELQVVFWEILRRLRWLGMGHASERWRNTSLICRFCIREHREWIGAKQRSGQVYLSGDPWGMSPQTLTWA